MLQRLIDAGPQSRADLARETGLTRVTMSSVVADLVSEEVLADLGPRSGTHMGKPATLVGLSEQAPLVISLDLSDHERFTGAVVDLSGEVIVREQTPSAHGEAAVRAVADLAGRLLAAAPRRVLGVGVGTPGVVDPAGVVLQAPNLDWESLDLAGSLSRVLDLPVHVGNDATVAATAEATFGDGDDRGLLMVRIGQGVGGGVLVDGHSLSGPLLSAGEIGHVVVDPDGRACACGNNGCLETFLAVPALRSLGDDEDRRHAGARLGGVLAPVVTTLGIADVVLNGPADLLEGPLLDAARQALARQSLPFVARRIQVRLVSADELVLTGAAALVRYRELGVV